MNLNSENVTNDINIVTANVIMSMKEIYKIIGDKKIAERLLVSKSNTIYGFFYNKPIIYIFLAMVVSK